MDPNASSIQIAKNAAASVNPVEPATPQTHQQQSQQNKMPISVPGSIEEGSAVMPENPDAGDDEEELRVAPQEIKNQAVGQQGVTIDSQEELITMGPSVPEFEGSPEVEKVVETTPDQEKPIISQEVKKAGVTHSGPGVIEVTDAIIPTQKLPVSFTDAVEEEKQTKLHDSKHWLMGKIIYFWRKINPKIALKIKNKLSGNQKSIVQKQQSETEQIEKLESNN